VEEVRAIFNQKYPAETNNTLGTIVRKAFPGVQRSRDSVSYYYSPLRWKLTVSDQQSSMGVKPVIASTAGPDPRKNVTFARQIGQRFSA